MTDPREAFDLTGRAAVVTGAGSGIGRASAQVLAGAGASVVCADIDGAAAEKTAAMITEVGGTARAEAVDVSDRRAVQALVDGAVGAYGRLDVMCNIAGIIINTAFVDTSEDDLDRVLGVNLKGVFFGCQSAARVMMEQGSGSIVNMASGAIDTPAPGLICYGVSKAGVAQLTKTVAMEAGPRGVRVNAIAPGFIVTNMTARHFTEPDGSVDEERKEATLAPMRRMSPLQRTGEPEDIAMAVLYLASDASRFVTGQIIRPNGGVSMPW